MTGADDEVDILVCVWRTKERCHLEWLRSSRITPANQKGTFSPDTPLLLGIYTHLQQTCMLFEEPQIVP